MTEQPPRPQIGGTDGHRGRVSADQTPGGVNETTFGAIMQATVEHTGTGRDALVVAGCDPRRSSNRLLAAVIEAANRAGVDVINLGVAPTPAVLRTAKVMGASAAAMVTASHNPPRDNGLKVTFGSDKPFGPQVQALSNRAWEILDSGLAAPASRTGTLVEAPGLVDAYVESIVDDIERLFDKERPLEGKIVVADGANGAGSEALPKALRLLGATVVEYACGDGRPINEGSGATNLSGVEAFLRARPDLVKHPDFIGVVAGDGDIDRMKALGVTIHNDKIYYHEFDGNHLIELQAAGKPGTVGTPYTNDAMIARLKVKFEFCGVGDAHVAAALRAKQANGKNWTTGGEFNGHNVDTDWLSSGDGVRNAAWLLTYAAINNTTIGELARSMPLWPELLTDIQLGPNITPAASKALLDHPAVAEAIAAAPVNLSGGRVLIRPSGTEPLMRAWGDGPERKAVHSTVNHIASLIRKYAAA